VLDSELINFTLIFKKINFIPKSSIQPKVLDNPEEVNKIQTWFVFVNYWVSRLYHHPNHNRAVEFINFVMNVGPQDHTKQQIYKILLISDDINFASNQIKQLL
jgi:hypothetical protein